MCKHYKLENWSVVSENNPYYPPETHVKQLSGYVYDNPKYPNGTKVRTSRILSSNGRLISTFGGSVYELGTVSTEYMDYLRSINRELDVTNPVKVISEDDIKKGNL